MGHLQFKVIKLVCVICRKQCWGGHLTQEALEWEWEMEKGEALEWWWDGDGEKKLHSVLFFLPKCWDCFAASSVEFWCCVLALGAACLA